MKHISSSADAWEDSGIIPLLHEMTIGRAFRDKIEDNFIYRNYGNNEIELFFVVNCLKFQVKNRVRFSKIDKRLYWDVILNYEIIKKASMEEKKEILAKSIIESFDVLDKYKKLNLNKDKIKEDAKKYFVELGWL